MNEPEWIRQATEQGLNVDLLETADGYVEQLREGGMTWRDYYQEVNEHVFIQQSDTT